MLQAIRSTAGSWIVKILFLLLILSFAVWGIGDMTTGWTSRSVAEVGDVEIPPDQLQEEFRREVNQLRQVLGPQLSDAQAVQLGLLDRTLQNLIQRALLTQAAGDIGIRVNDATVIEQVREVDAFRNPLGQFDPEMMRFVLRQNGFTEQGFVEQVRGDIARSQLLGAVGSGATAPRTLAQELYRYRGERRIADILTVPVTAVAEPADPDQETLETYHQENAVRYTAPEYRTLTVASLTADDLVEGIAVSEEELSEAYDIRAEEFITPDSRDVVQAVVGDRETAQAIADAAASGQSIEAAAEAAGAAAVELPGSTRESLLPELVEPVFAADVGAVAGPVESPFGWHVFTVRSSTPGGERTLEEVREELTADVRRNKAIDQLFEVANVMDDRLAGGASLTEAAQAVGATLTTLETVDNQGRTKAGTPAELETAPLADVLERGFALQSGETSNLVEAGEAAYFAVQVDGIEPAALRPLEDVRAQVVADWKADRRREAAAEQAEALAARLREGADPAALAAEVPGVTHTRTEPLQREADAPGPVAPSLREALFGIQQGEVVTAPVTAGVAVGKLVEVVPADTVLGAPQMDRIRTAAEGEIANDIVSQYLIGLRSRYEVQENRALIDSLFRPQE